MNPKNHSRKRRKYDEDFKAEVLKIIENRQSVSAVAQSLRVGENLISHLPVEKQTKNYKQTSDQRRKERFFFETFRGKSSLEREGQTDRD